MFIWGARSCFSAVVSGDARHLMTISAVSGNSLLTPHPARCSPVLWTHNYFSLTNEENSEKLIKNPLDQISVVLHCRGLLVVLYFEVFYSYSVSLFWLFVAAQTGYFCLSCSNLNYYLRKYTKCVYVFELISLLY